MSCRARVSCDVDVRRLRRVRGLQFSIVPFGLDEAIMSVRVGTLSRVSDPLCIFFVASACVVLNLPGAFLVAVSDMP